MNGQFKTRWRPLFLSHPFHINPLERKCDLVKVFFGLMPAISAGRFPLWFLLMVCCRGFGGNGPATCDVWVLLLAGQCLQRSSWEVGFEVWERVCIILPWKINMSMFCS